MRECDGGTAWDRVESENYSIMSPNQNIQVSCIFVHQLQSGAGQLANAVGMYIHQLAIIWFITSFNKP